MVNITIDGKKIEVADGTTVLEATRQAGVFIPTLCDHPELTPYGGCRLCLVEIEGARTLQPSCTMPAGNNMVVHTDTERVREARKFVLSLIFSERNHFCMYCQVSGGDCELQNSAYREGMTHWPLSPNYQPYPVDASNPYFVLDHNRCILCRRCVRACNELVGNYTLGFEERGAKSFLVADLGVPLGESSCVSCGTCVQVCPTGALIDRDSAYRGRETQVEHVKTTCIGCSIGCGIDVLTRDNHLVRIDGDWDSPVSNGVICKTGRFVPINDERERILTPMVRKNGSLKATTWEEALSIFASKIKAIASTGNDQLVAITSTRLPVEALSAFKQLFVDKLNSRMVTSIEEGCFTTAAKALSREMGLPFEGRLDSLKKADCVLVLGVDLVKDHQVASFIVKRNLPNGTNLIVVDTRANPLDDLAKISLKPVGGSEDDLLLGLAAEIVRAGYSKGQAPIDLSKYTLDTTAKVTGIKSELIQETARVIGSSTHPAFILGSTESTHGCQEILRPALELAMVSGVLDQSHSSVLCLKGEANSLAASLLDLDTNIELDGQQAAFIALGDDNPSQKLISSLEEMPFLAVQASFVSPLTARADVVLPVEVWSEQKGHFLSFEGRIQSSQRALSPADGIRANADVLVDLGKYLGYTLDPDWKTQLNQIKSTVILFE